MKSLNRIKLNGRNVFAATVGAVAWLVLNGMAVADHGGDDGGDRGGRGSGSPTGKPLTGYKQINLVSDVPGQAVHTETNLVNPWGLVIGPEGRLIVADNHTGLATFYSPEGRLARSPLPVDDDPTGVTINHSSEDFLITDGTGSHSARLIFATESGKILGWNQGLGTANAVVVADNSPSNAVYKGIALAETRGGAMLFATDFHNGKVDMFDSSFHRVGSFTDGTVDAGFAPFNVQNIGGWLFVTFAKQRSPDNHDDEAGPGNGFVDIFRPDGHLVRRFASHGMLNSPWGLAVATRSFGKFRDALLVGNFGDGRINAYNPRTGAFLGQLTDPHGVPIQIEGLWALGFGRDSDWGRDEDDDDVPNNALYFTSGPADESHGLLGVIVPARRNRHGD